MRRNDLQRTGAIASKRWCPDTLESCRAGHPDLPAFDCVNFGRRPQKRTGRSSIWRNPERPREGRFMAVMILLRLLSPD